MDFVGTWMKPFKKIIISGLCTYAVESGGGKCVSLLVLLDAQGSGLRKYGIWNKKCVKTTLFSCLRGVKNSAKTSSFPTFTLDFLVFAYRV